MNDRHTFSTVIEAPAHLGPRVPNRERFLWCRGALGALALCMGCAGELDAGGGSTGASATGTSAASGAATTDTSSATGTTSETTTGTATGTTSGTTTGTTGGATTGATAGTAGSSGGQPGACGDGQIDELVCFEAKDLIASGDVAYAGQYGDVSGDGNGDLVYLIGDSVVVHLGDGAGNFGLANLPIVVLGVDMQLVDLAEDGPLDAVVLGSDGDSVMVLTGDGSGGFTLTQTLTTGNGKPVDMAFGKIDAGSTVDMVLAMYDGFQWRAFTGVGDGTLAYLTGGVMSGPYHHLALGELTGDGNLDLVATRSDQVVMQKDYLLVAPGQPDGKFNNGTMLPVAMDGPFGAVGTGDFDGDGNVDVAYVSVEKNELRVMYRTGPLLFADPVVIPMDMEPTPLQVIDANGDGIDDVVVGHRAASVLNVVANEEVTAVPIPHPADFLGAGDVNGDGLPDLVATNSGMEALMTVMSNP